MNEIYLHVTGVVATEVSARTVDDVMVASFRMVSTTRRYDREQRTWVDGDKNWLTVTCWRGLAENVRKSVLKGERVVVAGKLKVSQWRDDEGRPRSRTEIVADAVGHDLAFGTTVLTRTPRVRYLEPTPRELVASSLAEEHERQTEDIDVDALINELTSGPGGAGRSLYARALAGQHDPHEAPDDPRDAEYAMEDGLDDAAEDLGELVSAGVLSPAESDTGTDAGVGVGTEAGAQAGAPSNGSPASGEPARGEPTSGVTATDAAAGERREPVGSGGRRRR